MLNKMVEAINNQERLIKSLGEESINPQEALNKNSQIVTKVVKQVNEVNRNFRVHVNTPRCTTCGSDSHWNGLKCMNCGAMDDGDY